ncbi:MAG: hypothetical protein AAGH79_06295 [Bacteroidota bacterium]
MHPVFQKMNFKGQKPILLLQAPESFQSILEDMKTQTTFHTEPSAEQKYAFVLAFLYRQTDLAQVAKLVAGRLEDDCLLWLAYPKKSSKTYKTDLSRDMSWQAIGDLGFEGVRQIAIDTDWSALRFREARFIKTMKRKSLRAMSAEGKKRTGQ